MFESGGCRQNYPSESSLSVLHPSRKKVSTGVASNMDVAAPSSDTEGNLIDLGFLVKASSGSMLHSRKLDEELPDSKKMQFLQSHWKPFPSFRLRFYQVTKNKKSWTVSFQHSWLEKFPWLVYSKLLDGGICKFCILFPEQPGREGARGAKPGVWPYRLTMDRIQKLLERTVSLFPTQRVTCIMVQLYEQTFFRLNFENPSARVDSRIMLKAVDQQEENKTVLREIVSAVEFLAKQGLPLRGHRDDKVDFSNENVNRGNFIATLRLLSKKRRPSKTSSVPEKCSVYQQDYSE